MRDNGGEDTIKDKKTSNDQLACLIPEELSIIWPEVARQSALFNFRDELPSGHVPAKNTDAHRQNKEAVNHRASSCKYTLPT